MNFKLSLLKSIIKEEVNRVLNEDSLLVKKIAKDLYTYLKKIGVSNVQYQQAEVGSSWKAIGSKEASKLQPNSAMIVVKKYNSPAGDTAIDITLVGEKSGIEGVEKKLLSAYPGLEQKDRIIKPHQMGMTNAQNTGNFILNFVVIEKTTKKGGFVSNTQTNKPAGSSPNIF
jgi:hypothetical protein